MENKKEQYKNIYMKEMNLNYLTMTKEDYILMETVLDSCLNENIKMNKKEFKNFINKIVKNDIYMEDIKDRIRGGNSE